MILGEKSSPSHTKVRRAPPKGRPGPPQPTHRRTWHIKTPPPLPSPGPSVSAKEHCKPSQRRVDPVRLWQEVPARGSDRSGPAHFPPAHIFLKGGGGVGGMGQPVEVGTPARKGGAESGGGATKNWGRDERLTKLTKKEKQELGGSPHAQVEGDLTGYGRQGGSPHAQAP